MKFFSNLKQLKRLRLYLTFTLLLLIGGFALFAWAANTRPGLQRAATVVYYILAFLMFVHVAVEAALTMRIEALQKRQ